MIRHEREKIMLAEHVLEVRHDASGTFLDVRGFIADYVRKENFLPHWEIDANVINFRDHKDRVKSEGAFVGYRSAGYVVLNSQSRNFFPDRAAAFWKLILKNEHYRIPQPSRFGSRTKVFIPSEKSFDDINKEMFEGLFSERMRSLVGGTETDLQFTLELKEKGYGIRIMGGPIHRDEARRFFQFESEGFQKCGLFLDIDFFTADNLSLEIIPKLLKDAVDLTWQKAEHIASGLGL